MSQLQTQSKGVVVLHDFHRNMAKALPELLRQLKWLVTKLCTWSRTLAFGTKLRKTGHCQLMTQFHGGQGAMAGIGGGCDTVLAFGRADLSTFAEWGMGSLSGPNGRKQGD